MKSSTRYLYINSSGETKEVYSPDNPPPKKSIYSHTIVFTGGGVENIDTSVQLTNYITVSYTLLTTSNEEISSIGSIFDIVIGETSSKNYYLPAIAYITGYSTGNTNIAVNAHLVRQWKYLQNMNAHSIEINGVAVKDGQVVQYTNFTPHAKFEQDIIQQII